MWITAPVPAKARYSSRWVDVSEDALLPGSAAVPSASDTRATSSGSRSPHATPLALIATTPAARSTALTLPKARVASPSRASSRFAPQANSRSPRSSTARLRRSRSGRWVCPTRRQVYRMAAARFEDELEHRLGVEVVELDRLPDPAAHQDLCAAGFPFGLEGVGVRLRMHHAGDVLHTLAMLLQPLLVDARPVQRLHQFDDETRLHLTLRTEHREGNRLTTQVRVVELGWDMLIDVPRPPAQGVVKHLHRGVEIVNDHGDLGDVRGRLQRGHGEPSSLARLWRAPLSATAVDAMTARTSHDDWMRAPRAGLCHPRQVLAGDAKVGEADRVSEG